ncbi:C25 family cysteine peptidase [Prevotella sp. E15-22]|uniref:C25 family cysteine peptidase n=1 Tax=Prevotella sp. E15-22 TaxID=2937774 RepID=UPI00206A401D|nr:C25 family cysteine peptidase [Prevotella sp. E15-22]UPS45123.1 C25 family cysteine peptidase [Prevotella sp. E15-22]
MNYIKVLITFCLFAFANKSFSQEIIPIGNNYEGATVEKDVLVDDDATYEVRVKINGLHDEIISNSKGDYHRLSFDDEGNLGKVGEPALPVVSFLIAIPSGKIPQVSIHEESWDKIQIGNIFPTQPSSFDGDGYGSFYINENVYKESFLPQKLKISEEMNWRGIRNVVVQICPFNYYPKDNCLNVLKDFVVRISFQKRFTNQRNVYSVQRESNRFGLFDNSVFVSKNSKLYNSETDNYDYLIIVGSDDIYHSQSLKEFRRWKALKGFKTKAILVDSIGNDESLIKNYISSEYSKGVRYALLVGDVNLIKTKRLQFLDDYFNPTDQKYYSDYWYGCVLGNDEEQDVAIGRFPVSSLEQFTNIVRKTIQYESWKNLYYRALLMAHKQHNGYYYDYIPCCDSIKNRSYVEPLLFYKVYGTDPNSTNSTVNSIINQGTHIINYRGHASVNYWGNPDWNKKNESYSNMEIDSLSPNTNSVFFSIACNSGNIGDPDSVSMLEVFTCSPKGAAAFLGSSTASDTWVNSTYNKMIYRYLLDSAEYRFSDINMKAFISLIREQPNAANIKNNAYSYICGGDPSLELWTATPQKINAVEVDYIDGKMVINTADTCQYDVFISSVDGDLLGKLFTNDHSVIFPKPAEKFYLSLVKHNRIPYVVYCDFERNSLQAVNVDYNGFYGQTPFAMGERVNEDDEIGDVVIKNESKINIKLGDGGVLLDNGFKVEKGGKLIIKH